MSKGELFLIRKKSGLKKKFKRSLWNIKYILKIRALSDNFVSSQQKHMFKYFSLQHTKAIIS